MGKTALQWLTSLGTGALTAALAYITAHTGDATTPIAGIDPLWSFVGVTLITRIVHFIGAKVGAPPAPTNTLR